VNIDGSNPRQLYSNLQIEGDRLSPQFPRWQPCPSNISPVNTGETTSDVTIPSSTTLSIGAQAVVVLDTRNDKLNRRDNPSTSAKVVDQLAHGTIIRVIGGSEEAEGYTWWQVENEAGNVGWVVEAIDGVPRLVPYFAPTSDVFELAVGMQVRVMMSDPADKLNIIKEQLSYGDVVTIIKEAVQQDGFNWWKIENPQGKNGWVVDTVAGVQSLIPVSVDNVIVSSDQPTSVTPKNTFLVSISDMYDVPNVRMAPSVSVSLDGRFLAFTSSSALTGSTNSNCYTGEGTVRPRCTYVFIYDRIENTTMDIAASTTNETQDSPVISADGNFVAFSSAASNLVADGGDVDQVYCLSPIRCYPVSDVFLFERRTRAIIRVSQSINGSPADSASDSPSISEDGRFITFVSDATNLVMHDTNNAADIFVYDRVNDEVELVSVDSNGMQGNGPSKNPVISSDGRYIAYESEATNLIDSDTNGATDVFLYDRETRITSLVSKNSVGRSANAASISPAISANGNIIAFQSYATDISGSFEESSCFGEIADGCSNVFVYDTISRISKLVSATSTIDGVKQVGGYAFEPSISGNGLYVSYISKPLESNPDSVQRPSISIYNASTDSVQPLNSPGPITGLLTADGMSVVTVSYLNSSPVISDSRIQHNYELRLLDTPIDLPVCAWDRTFSRGIATERVLILIQGITSNAENHQIMEEQWQEITDKLKSEYSHIVYFSYDRSSPSRYWGTDTFKSIYDHHVPLLHNLIQSCILRGAKSFDVIGHSMGGLVAWEYIKRYGLTGDQAGLVKNVITLDAPINGASQNKKDGLMSFFANIRFEDEECTKLLSENEGSNQKIWFASLCPAGLEMQSLYEFRDSIIPENAETALKLKRKGINVITITNLLDNVVPVADATISGYDLIYLMTESPMGFWYIVGGRTHGDVFHDNQAINAIYEVVSKNTP
jgi:pimeloyl-ACP methyl ester carboxylesterase